MTVNWPTQTLNWSSGGQLVNQRIVFVSLLGTQGALISGAFTQLIAKGFTCRGSSNGVTAALDGVNRLTTAAGFAVRGANTTTAQSWGVVTDASGVQWCFAYTGSSDDIMRISKSAVAGFVIAGTATFVPTATDEEVVVSTLSTIGNTASGDRVFNVLVNSTATAWRMFLFRANVCTGVIVSGHPYALSADVISPAAPLGPQTVGWFLAAPSSATLANQIAAFNGSVSGSLLRFTVPAGSVSLQAGGIVAAPFGATNTDDGVAQEINGGVASISPLGIYASQTNAHGNVGMHVDLWNIKDAQAAGALGGPTLGREFVYLNNSATPVVSSLLLPWDGTTASCVTV